MLTMQMDENDMKVEKSVSMHSHAFERPCKRQIVTDPKSRSALHLIIYSFTNLLICVLTNYPRKPNFHSETPPKGMQSSYFYVADPLNVRYQCKWCWCLYQKKKHWLYCLDGETNRIHKDYGKSYYNLKHQYVFFENTIQLQRSYNTTKCFLLTQQMSKSFNL